MSGVVFTAFGQETVDSDGWMGSVEFDPAVISVNKGTKTTVSFTPRLTATHKVMPYLALGGGIELTEGWSFKGAPSMAIFGRVHAEDFSRVFSPIFDLDLGYHQSFEMTSYRGFMFNPTIGVRYGSFGFGMGYKGIVASGGALSNAINIRLAYYFGYHKNEKFCQRMSEFFHRIDYALALGCIFPFGDGHRYGHDMKTKTGGTLEFTGLYRFSNNFTGGLLIGLNYVPYSEEFVANPGSSSEFRETMTDGRSAIIVALRGRYDFRQISLPLGIHPFAKMDFGVAANLDTNEGTSSLYYSPGVGLSLPIKNDAHSLDLGVSYAPVSIEKDESWGADCKVKDIGSLRLTLGYRF